MMIFGAALPLAGCDANVTDEQGGGGAQSEGGSSDGGGGGSSDAGGAGGAGGSLSGDEAVAQACGEWCDLVPQCKNDGQTCDEFCSSGAPTGCELEYAALTHCVVPFTDDCAVPTNNCPEERQAFAACAASAPPTHCEPLRLTSINSGCESTGICVTGKSARMSCEEDPNGITCQCYVDEQLLGECADTEATCMMSHSCCSQFY